MSRPIRVALLATVTEFGGIEQVLLTLLDHMDADVELFPVVFTRQDARQESFFERLRAMDVPHASYVNARKRRYFNLVRNIGEAVTTFRQHRFDVVHCHGYRADLIGFVVSKRFGLPLVSTCHGFTPNDRYLRLYKGLDFFLLRRFTNVIAVSARVKEDLVARGVDTARVHVITNAVAAAAPSRDEKDRVECRSRLGIDNGEFVFGFVGRLSEEKGVHYLVRAAKGLSNGDRPWRLVVVGDGPCRNALTNTVRELGLTPKVDFVGFQDNTSAWYAAMDAFVLPSLTEGTPVALLEAMGHGLPVIASAVGGVPAILTTEKNGLLVPPRDSEKLRDAMRVVSTDSGLRQRLSREALRTIREAHDVQSWTRRVRDVYMTSIQERGEAG